MIRLPTWVYEQAVLVALLLPGTVLALQADPTGRGAARTALTFVGALAGQKARSGADRKREQAELLGLSLPEVACHRAIARWSAIGQVTAILQALVPAASVTRWTFLATAMPLAFTMLYGTWRAWYRARRPATLEVV